MRKILAVLVNIILVISLIPFYAVPVGALTCVDADGDGFGDGTDGNSGCPEGTDTDCDDADPDVNPGATEVCDGIDNNCDGQVDEGGVCLTPCTLDSECDDGIACTEDGCDSGFCRNFPHDSVCDDGRICNGLEICDVSNGCLVGTDRIDGYTCDEGSGFNGNMCDSSCQDGVCTAVFADDGSVCGKGLVCNSGLCNYTCTPSLEICDGLDNDCDLIIDDVDINDLLTDENNCGECGNYCEAGETCDNGKCTCSVEADCLGVAGTSVSCCGSYCIDRDSDVNYCGGTSCASSIDCTSSVFQNMITECISATCEYECTADYVDADGDPSNGCEVECIGGPQPEVCDDSIDNNCDGQVDENCPVDADGDGYYAEDPFFFNEDCDDNNASINPGAEEVCNSVDDNCDGDIDFDIGGSVCGPDADADRIIDDDDNCPLVANYDQTDTDNDGVGDVCDNCVLDSNPLQEDANANNVGDLCEGTVIVLEDETSCLGIGGTWDAGLNTCYKRFLLSISSDETLIINGVVLNIMTSYFGSPNDYNSWNGHLDNFGIIINDGTIRLTNGYSSPSFDDKNYYSILFSNEGLLVNNGNIIIDECTMENRGHFVNKGNVNEDYAANFNSYDTLVNNGVIDISGYSAFTGCCSMNIGGDIINNGQFAAAGLEVNINSQGTITNWDRFTVQLYPGIAVNNYGTINNLCDAYFSINGGDGLLGNPVNDFCAPDAEDTDLDGIPNDIDNCPDDSNEEQTDSDYDNVGDVCDVCPYDRFDDQDLDGLCADVDNCPLVSNINQSDIDDNGIGDLCQDTDADGVLDLTDNCVTVFNPLQTDTDGDGIGDDCWLMNFGTITQTKKLTPSDGVFNDEFGYVSISGDTIVVAAEQENASGIYSGSLYVYERDLGGADNWGEHKKLVPSDGAVQDRLGTVSISGDTIVAGAYFKDGRTGAAYVFERNLGGTNNWGEAKKLVASDALADDFFGSSVSISGDLIAVGAHNKNSSSGDAVGAVYLFGRNNGGVNNWGEIKKLTASDEERYDRFGISVSILGDLVVVGAVHGDSNDTQTGAVYLFSRNAGGADNWGEIKKLTPSDNLFGVRFGESVSMSGDYLIVGAPADPSFGILTGAAYIFNKDLGGTDNWGEVKKIIAGDAKANGRFGYSVSIIGDKIVIGARDDTTSAGTAAGAAYIFSIDQGGIGNWGQITKLEASDAIGGEQLGYTVSISGTTIVAGAPRGYKGTVQTGAGYVFENEDIFLDRDGDGVPNYFDNCIGTPNDDQIDSDDNGLGDVCDPAVCGNGYHELGEECDDGNTQSGDGCSSTCTVECIPTPEDCDNIDNDCDGQVDEDMGTTSCGLGVCYTEIPACVNGNWQACAVFTDDPELCGNGLDDDCDGQTDEADCVTDSDGDGYTSDVDCDDADPDVNPGATEVCDGIDNDCDGTIDEGGICDGACAGAPDGLIGWWPGDGNASDIAEGNDGTPMNGVTFAPGKVGQAFSFDGTDDYVDIPYNSIFNLSSFTLEAWVKFNDTGVARIISRPSDGNPTDGYSFFSLHTSNGKIGGGVQGEGQGYSVSVGSGISYADNDWHLGHFVRDVGENTISVYVDGDFRSSYPDSSPGGMTHNYQGLYIGSYSGGSQFFKGLVDEVSIYNRALNGSEILEIYNSGSFGKCKELCVPETEVCDGQDNDCNSLIDDGIQLPTQLKITSPDADQSDYFQKADMDMDTIVVGAEFDDEAGNGAGAAYIYQRDVLNSSNWLFVKKLMASDAEPGDYFGRDVAISGDLVVVGSPSDDSQGSATGAAYVFSRNQGGSNNWGEVKKLMASDAAQADWFGDVDISGDNIAVGAWGNDDLGDMSGSAYIFNKDQGGTDNWGEVKKILASDGQAVDKFSAVSIDGDVLVVGADQEDSWDTNAGAAYIFERNQDGTDNWGEVKKLTASDGAYYDRFGRQTAVYGDTVVVSAMYGNTGLDDAQTGSAYVFSRNQGGSNNWGEVKELEPINNSGIRYFGASLSVSNDKIAVLASWGTIVKTNTGTVFVYEKDFGGTNNWGLIGYRTIPNASDQDYGSSVSIQDQELVMGAQVDVEGITDAGAIYYFDRIDSTSDCDSDGVFDFADNCFGDYNPLQEDQNKDGIGDACQPDMDYDGILNEMDNCPEDYNPLQEDMDTDGEGDACDEDIDGDGVNNNVDNCEYVPNPLQEDLDSDGFGAACDCDDNNMDINPDAIDYCDGIDNNCDGQVDEGDACVDSDGDGVYDLEDGCPNDFNKIDPGQCGCGNPDTDSDGDGTADCNDNCPADPNKTNPGTCGCGVADADTDGDGTLDCNDNCPNDPDKTEPGVCGCGVTEDTADQDGDGIINCFDNCKYTVNAGQEDEDDDGFGDACDDYYSVHNEYSCVNLLYMVTGTPIWDEPTKTCTLPPGSVFNIASLYDTVEIDGYAVLENHGLMDGEGNVRAKYGTLRNYGTMLNDGFYGDYSTWYDGVIENYGFINASLDTRGGPCINYGELYVLGSHWNAEEFRNEEGGLYENPGYVRNFPGSWFRNEGTVNNYGTFVNDASTFGTPSSVYIYQSPTGVWNNYNVMENSHDVTFYNSGILNNYGNISSTISSNIDGRGEINNHGYIYSTVSCHIATRVLNNYGTIVNTGGLTTLETMNNDGIIDNSGSFYISKYDQYCHANNTGIIYNRDGPHMTEPLMSVWLSGCVLENHNIIENYNLTENKGTIINYATFNNYNTINNINTFLNVCGADPVGGTITGNPIMDVCDTDGDTVADIVDNCPNDPNLGQEDCNGDGTGDACDAINPGATEVCDGLDNNCDGQVDEGNVCFGCGFTVTESMVMDEDLNCTEEGLIIGADDVTFDCNGYTIQGSGAPIGILADHINNVVIQDCVTQNLSVGIMFNSTNNSQLINNDISGNIIGIMIGSENNLLQGNLFDDNGVGVYIAPGASNNSVDNNNATENAIAIAIEQRNEEMAERLADAYREGSDSAKEMLKMALRIIQEHQERQEQNVCAMTEGCGGNSASNNDVDNNTVGIEDGGVNNSVEDNAVTNNGFGVIASGAFSRVEGNTVSGSTWAGILASNSTTIVENQLSGNDIGALVTQSEEAGTVFENFDQKSNQLFNLLSSVLKSMKEMQSAIVRNFNGGAPPDEGVQNNTVTDNNQGILVDANNTNVSGNSVTNNGIAINVPGSANTVKYNLLDDNAMGIILSGPNNHVESNNISNTILDAIWVLVDGAVNDNKIEKARIAINREAEFNAAMAACESKIEEIREKVQEAEDQFLSSILMAVAQSMTHVASVATFSGNSIAGSSVGIAVGNFSDTVITNNTLDGNGIGISVGGSDNTVSSNIVKDSIYGIILFEGSNTVTSNDIGDAYFLAQLSGVAVMSPDNLVSNNTITGGDTGITDLVEGSLLWMQLDTLMEAAQDDQALQEQLRDMADQLNHGNKSAEIEMMKRRMQNNLYESNMVSGASVGLEILGNDNVIQGNTVSNGLIGILLAEDNNTVDSNTVTNNTFTGITVGSSGNTVTGNLAGFSSRGFSDIDIDSLAQIVMFEVWQSEEEALQNLLEELQRANEVKEQQRGYINEMRGIKNSFSNNVADNNGVGFDIGGSLSDFTGNTLNNNDIGFFVAPYNLSNGTTVLPTDNNFVSNVLTNNDFGFIAAMVKDTVFDSNTGDNTDYGLYVSPGSVGNNVTFNEFMDALSGYMQEFPHGDVMAALFFVFQESIEVTNADKEYMLARLAKMNEIADAQADYLKYLADISRDLAEAIQNETENTENGLSFSYFADADADAIYDYMWGYRDNCLVTFNPDILDSDGDGQGDVCDPCPKDPNDECDPDESAGVSISEEGGNLTLGTKVEVYVPPGALSDHTSISVTGGNGTNVTDVPTFEDTTGVTGTSLVYTFGPEDTTFNEPVELTMGYDDTGVAEDTVDVYYYEPVTQTFEPQGATVNTATNEATLSVLHFSTFIVGAYADADGDNYGVNVDCDDTDPDVYPGAPEVCNGLDNDCDGTIDNGGDSLCDNGLWCDGAETCAGVDGCQPGTPPECGDGVGCTDDSCNESTDSCDSIPNDGHCTPDAWFDIGSPYWTDIPPCDREERQDQEYRDHYCDPIIDCQYAVTDTRYVVLQYEDNDEDDDGVCDDVDKCGGSIPENPWYALQELKPNHYDSSNWPASDVNYGCSCSQILYCKPGGNTGEFKFGCSEGTKNIWEAQSNESWALECQVDGKVASEGVSKFFFENTDGDWLPDILDGDNDGDGIPDYEDDMIEDQDPPGDPDYGIPDWHPKSKHKN